MQQCKKVFIINNFSKAALGHRPQDIWPNGSLGRGPALSNAEGLQCIAIAGQDLAMEVVEKPEHCGRGARGSMAQEDPQIPLRILARPSADEEHSRLASEAAGGVNCPQQEPFGQSLRS